MIYIYIYIYNPSSKAFVQDKETIRRIKAKRKEKKRNCQKKMNHRVREGESAKKYNETENYLTY